jgi:hypothetical protein
VNGKGDWYNRGEWEGTRRWRESRIKKRLGVVGRVGRKDHEEKRYYLLSLGSWNRRAIGMKKTPKTQTPKWSGLFGCLGLGACQNSSKPSDQPHIPTPVQKHLSSKQVTGVEKNSRGVSLNYLGSMVVESNDSQ